MDVKVKSDLGFTIEQAVLADDYKTLELIANDIVGTDEETAHWVRNLAVAAYNNVWGYDELVDNSL